MKNEKRIQAVEQEVEKTNRTLYICVGTGLAGLVVVATWPSYPIAALIGAAGAGAGQGVHYITKRIKKRRERENKNE